MFVISRYAVCTAWLSLAWLLGNVAPVHAQNSQSTLFQEFVEALTLGGGRPLLIPAPDVEGEALATLVINHLNVEVGGVVPTGKPSLGTGQAIASKNGYYVSGGPGLSIPLAPVRPGSPFALRFGADIFYSHVTPDRIVNLGGGNPLQLSNSSKDQAFGAIFYGGVALASARRWQFTFDAGLGPARRTVELNGLVNPLASGGDTVLAGRIRGGINFAVTRNITLGGFVGYQWIGGTSVRVNATGAQLALGRQESVYAGINLTILAGGFERATQRRLAPRFQPSSR